MKWFLLAGLAAALAAPLTAEAQMSRFEAACVLSVIRFGSVPDAEGAKAACRCAERSLNTNGVTEQVRDANNMYRMAGDQEFFVFDGPRRLWAGHDPGPRPDYPWLAPQRDRSTVDGYARAIDGAATCLSPTYLSADLLRLAGPKQMYRPDMVVPPPADTAALKSLKLVRKTVGVLDIPPRARRTAQSGNVAVAVKLNAENRAIRLAVISNETGNADLADLALFVIEGATFVEGQRGNGEFDGFATIGFSLTR